MVGVDQKVKGSGEGGDGLLRVPSAHAERRKWREGAVAQFWVEQRESGRGPELKGGRAVSCGHVTQEGEGVQTRAAAARGRRRRVAHGGGRERERRERAGEVGQWAGPQNGSHLSAKEGGREREWQVGPAAIQIKFEIIQICYNLV
jgi:hypothetical protein